MKIAFSSALFAMITLAAAILWASQAEIRFVYDSSSEFHRNHTESSMINNTRSFEYEATGEHCVDLIVRSQRYGVELDAIETQRVQCSDVDLNRLTIETDVNWNERITFDLKGSESTIRIAEFDFPSRLGAIASGPAKESFLIGPGDEHPILFVAANEGLIGAGGFLSGSELAEKLTAYEMSFTISVIVRY